jgi:Xaa-Pro aminopeptidase
MEPVIKHGLSTWDRAMLPPDEFESRQAALDELSTSLGLAAVVGFENSTNPGLVGYLENYRTAAEMTTLICVPGVDATLLAGLGGTRDHPSIKAMSLTQDVRWFPDTGPGVATVLAERGISEGRIGVAGLNDCLCRDEVDAILLALQAYDIVDFDSTLDGLRRAKRERELVAIRAARAILNDSAAALSATMRNGGDVHGAIVAGERVARLSGCRDFRALALARDGSLRPWPDAKQTGLWSKDPFTVYLAAEYLGYWSEVAVSNDALSEAARWTAGALAAAQSHLRAGSNGASLRAALESSLGDAARHVTLEATGIGLGLVEAPVLGDYDLVTLREGDLLSLRAWAREGRTLSLAIAHVLVGVDGCGPLVESNE